MPKSNFERPVMSDLVSRSFHNYRAERREESNTAVITGEPIVFNQPTDICGWFEEVIVPEAISEDVLRDVAFFYNHDLNTKPHARTRTGKLRFEITPSGVNMTADVNLDRSDTNDLYLAIRDGDIDGMSFMFRIEKEEWSRMDTDYPLRTITKIGYVQEVSAVNYPAYESTSINARDARSDLSLDSDKKALDEARAKYSAVDTANKSLDSELELLKAKAIAKLIF